MKLSNGFENWNWPRSLVVAVAAASAAVVWIHALARLTRQLGAADAPPAAGALTLAALALGLLSAVPARRTGALAGLVVGSATAVLAALSEPAAWASCLALPLMGALIFPAARTLARALPRNLDEIVIRRRRLAVFWLIFALASLIQTSRLSTFVADPEHGFLLTTTNPFWYGHLCLPAYFHGAELAERGDPNLYDARHYPGLHPSAEPETSIAGMPVEDPYQYPPQFLLLPWSAIQISHDFATLRVFWFAFQATLFVGIFIALALWTGGSPGSAALWSLPLVAQSFPVLFNLQYGQFHLSAVALAIGGMLAFSRKHGVWGGLMLASAILAKLFPAVLLPFLLFRRRYRELGWVCGWGAAITLLTLLVLGPAPFTSFVNYHLPRLSDGSAFAFDEAWPEVAELLVADNQGAFGLAMKFGLDKAAAGLIGKLFTVLVLLTATWAGWRFRAASRWGQAILWLSLLGLGSMASPGAWGDYVPSVAVWLLALLVPLALHNRQWIAPLVVAALFEGLLLGTTPIGDWAPISIMIPVSAVGCLILLALYGATLAAKPAGYSEDAPLQRRRSDLGTGDFEPAT